jgi:CubicO group peptidase (beta-lactamase class C family)
MVFIVISAGCTFAQATIWPTNGWQTATSAEMNMDQTKLEEARDYALRGGGAGYITRGGKLVLSWGDINRKWDVKSATKGIGMTAMGIAITDGRMQLSDKAGVYHPDLTTGKLADIKLIHLATHTSGFPKPGGASTSLLFDPGTMFSYSDAGPNWLAECITLEYRQDIETFLFDRVFTHLGMTSSDLHWRDNWYRPDLIDGIKRREFGAGAQVNADGMARIGYLYLRNGMWEDSVILLESFIKAVGDSVEEIAGVPNHQDYTGSGTSSNTGLLWWHNETGRFPDVPRDAFWAHGMWNNLIIVIPSLDVVASRVSNEYFPNRDMEPFITAVAQSVTGPITESYRPGILYDSPIINVVPNPFKHQTSIRIATPYNEQVHLSIFDINGKLVSAPFDSEKISSNYTVNLDTRNWGSGLYFAHLQAGKKVFTKKLIVSK